MYCEKCGKEIPDISVFCRYCGMKTSGVQDDAAALSPGPNGAPTAVPPPVYPTAHQDGYVQTAPTYQSRPTISQYSAVPGDDRPLSMGQFLAMFLLSCIPIVNIILLIIWGFGSNTKQTKRNFARAALIMVGIGVVMYIIIYAAMGAMIGNMFSYMDYY